MNWKEHVDFNHVVVSEVVDTKLIKVGLFDWIGSITTSKKDLMSLDTRASYSPFIINMALSSQIDCIMHINHLNVHHTMPKEWHYKYLQAAIKKGKRKITFDKKRAKDFDIECVMKYYNYNEQRAIEAIELLSFDQLQRIVGIYDTGGQ